MYHGFTEFGCDSVTTLDFTLLESTSSFTEASGCDQFVWNGDTYSESGTYEWLTVGSEGCDSTAVVEVEIYPDVSL